MIQSFSQNITVNAQTAIPFNNTFTKGCTVEQTAPATFQFNKKGLYLVTFDASVSSATAGNAVFQMFVNDQPVPYGITYANTSTAADVESCSFTARVSVGSDNSCACSQEPVTVQVKNNGTIPVTAIQTNIVITKLC